MVLKYRFQVFWMNLPPFSIQKQCHVLEPYFMLNKILVDTLITAFLYINSSTNYQNQQCFFYMINVSNSEIFPSN